MKNIRLTFATVTVLSFCSGFINPIWAGKSDEKNFEISRNLDIFNSLFKELNMFMSIRLMPRRLSATV